MCGRVHYMWNGVCKQAWFAWVLCSLWSVKAPWTAGGHFIAPPVIHTRHNHPACRIPTLITLTGTIPHNKMGADKQAKSYIRRLLLMAYTITFSVKSLMEKWKNVLSWSKNSRKVFTTDIFIYESLEVWRGSKNVGWIYLLNKGQQNTTTNIRRKTHSRSKIFQSGEMWKCSQRRIAPADDKCQNNSDKEKKGGKYEWTEGTTIIYVNNVPLLLIISGKIKQKRKGGRKKKHHACHPTNFSHAN